jgi:hypothetical protein
VHSVDPDPDPDPDPEPDPDPLPSPSSPSIPLVEHAATIKTKTSALFMGSQ